MNPDHAISLETHCELVWTLITRFNDSSEHAVNLSSFIEMFLSDLEDGLVAQFMKKLSTMLK